ncbi:NAD-dependent protein deacetylase sirtuin-2-like isoform X2 [Saccostrea cucullata]|uniref:NAD-dependent protein deacetylase sirtuin-2-like isoform X2 n=1 Tax=Saccostrea cuccullata TaxID=36930 RepID=UPI002ED6B42B
MMTDSKSIDNTIKDDKHADSSLATGQENKEKVSKKEFSKDQEYLKEYFAKALGLRPPPKQVLSTVDMEGIAKLISEGKAKNIITMAGAGISTSAGIPDFRSPKTGLYDNLEKFNLPNPQAVFSIDYFKENPVPYFTVRKEMILGNFKPTPCHYFIRMLSEKGLLLRHYTQNIDALERTAGIDPDLMMEAHGSNRVGHCLNCSSEYSHKWIKDILRKDGIPKCTVEGCTGTIKPDTVFFGEQLPKRFTELVDQDFDKCDLLIILGTSLKVQPFARITSRVPDETPRLYINLEKTGTEANHPLCVLVFGGGFKFDDEDNYRDVFVEAACDDGCYRLADLLGWGDELRDLVKREHAKLDVEFEEEERAWAASQIPVSTTANQKPCQITPQQKNKNIKNKNVTSNRKQKP